MGVLAIAFSPCLSRKRRFREAKTVVCDGLFSLPVEEKAVSKRRKRPRAPQKDQKPSPCQRKGTPDTRWATVLSNAGCKLVMKETITRSFRSQSHAHLSNKGGEPSEVVGLEEFVRGAKVRERSHARSVLAHRRRRLRVHHRIIARHRVARFARKVAGARQNGSPILASSAVNA